MMIQREFNPVFVQARAALERVLGKYGYRVMGEIFAHAAFGSAQVTLPFGLAQRWRRARH